MTKEDDIRAVGVLTSRYAPTWTKSGQRAFRIDDVQFLSLRTCLLPIDSFPCVISRFTSRTAVDDKQENRNPTLPVFTTDILQHIFTHMAGEDITTQLTTDGYRRALPLALTCKSYYAAFTRAIRGVAVLPFGFASRRASLPPPDPAPYLQAYSTNTRSDMDVTPGKNWFGQAFSGGSGVFRKKITDNMIHRMLLTLDGLRELELSMAVAISDDGVVDIARLCPNLRSFKLNSNHTIGRRSVQALSTCSKLEVLDMNFCTGFFDDSASCISKMPSLTSLYIARWRISDLFFKILFRKDRCKNMRVLGLNGCEAITYKSVKYISHGTGCSLEHLNLRSCRRINDLALEYVVYHCRNLESIDVSYNDIITPTGVGLLRGLEKLRNVQVSQCSNATDGTVSELCQGCPLVSVKLSWCQQLTNVSAFALSACHDLSQVNLSGCRRLTDRAVEALACLPRLERLKLTYCSSLTDASADFLADAANKPLTEIDLRRCRGISFEAMDRLRKQCVLLLDSAVALNCV